MKRIAGFILALALLVVPAHAGSNEYTVSIVGTPTNVADYLIYSDEYPTGHAGPGDFFYSRSGDAVHVWGKLDLKPTTSGGLMIVQLSLPFPGTFSNYAYAVGHVTQTGGKPAGTIFGSQVGVEGNDTTVVIRVIAATETPTFRAYAVTFDYIADPLD